MADLNTINISGTVEGVGIKEGQYPYGWIRLKIDKVIYHDIADPIRAHIIFVGLNINTAKDREKMATITRGAFIMVTDATLAHWFKDKTEIHKLQAVSSRIRVISTPLPYPENTALLSGKVIAERGNREWLRISSGYVNPNAKDGEPKWKTRNIKVWVPEKFRKSVQVTHTYYINGQLSGLEPGTTTVEDLLVIASNIV